METAPEPPRPGRVQGRLPHGAQTPWEHGRLLLTVCLKPTAVCCGAFRRAFVMVLLASEYSS